MPSTIHSLPPMLDNFPPAALYPAYLTPEMTGGTTSGSSSGDNKTNGPPATPKSYADLSHIIFEPDLKTTNLAPHAYSQLLHNLCRSGPLCGSTFGSICDEDDPTVAERYYARRPPTAGERRIPEWVRGAQAALEERDEDQDQDDGHGHGQDVSARALSPPPLEPPLSPTMAAPCLPQSERLRQAHEETTAIRDEDAVSETDKTCLQAHFYQDDDVVSETEPLGPPVTDEEDYYVHRHDVEPPESGNVVQPLEEITENAGQPQDLLENLQENIARLRRQARYRPRMLEQIDLLDAQAIVVVEMTSKLSRRVGYCERVVEEKLPELDDEKANAALFRNLHHRLVALEECVGATDDKSPDDQSKDTSQPDSQDRSPEQDKDVDAMDVDEPVRANL